MQTFVNVFFMVKLFPSILIASCLFAFSLPRREKFALRFSLSAAVCLAFSIALWMLVRRAPADLPFGKFVYVLVNLVFFLEVPAFLCFNFRCSFFEALLFDVCGWSVEHLSSSLSYIFALLAGSGPVDYRNYSVEFFLITFFTYLIVYALAGIVYWCLRVKGRARLERSRLIIPSMILMGTVFVLNIYTPFETMTDTAQIFVRLYAVACCLASLCAMFGIFDSGRYRFELELLDQIARKKQEQYEISKEAIEIINVKCHDLKKMISSAVGGKKVLTDREMREIDEKLSIYDAIVKTGNDALDLILTEKSLFCEKNNIRLTMMVDAESFGFLSDAEIYALFGNILDNAVEAVLNVVPEKRIVSLNVKRANKMLSVHEENYFSGELRYKEGGLATSKANLNDHGFGIISIRRIVEKYDGAMKISSEGDVFNLDILIPLEK